MADGAGRGVVGAGSNDSFQQAASMTLVAAYREHGVPILLGDLLIDDGSQSQRSGKKIHLLAPTLAVGWTGVQIAAGMVLRELHACFAEQLPTRAILADALRSLGPDMGQQSVQLVGWIWDDEPHCFLWDSTLPDTITYADSHVKGSGAAAFESLRHYK